MFELNASITAESTISCVLSTTGTDEIFAPLICFSILDQPRVVSGGRLVESFGGFCAIQLDASLSKNSPVNFEIAYARHHPNGIMNRAWLPLGPYLRFEDGNTQAIQTHYNGVRFSKPKLTQPDNDMLRLVPQPTHWQASGDIRPFGSILMPNSCVFEPAFSAVDALAFRNGLGPLFGESGEDITVVNDPDVQASAYVLTIETDMIEIRVSDYSGALYAAISLLNLRTNYENALPTGVINNAPRFNWRGQHLDCARHFFEPATILRLIDLMALLKMNVFHWHFADDEAFRLEIETYPELWQQSAFRGEGQTIPGVFGGSAEPTGGTYSLNTARKVIGRAKELSIDVLPEIEFPAHALALARTFPHLRDPNDTGTEMSVQSYSQNTIDPALPETWEFILNLSRKVAAIFPFSHLHVGGDELPPDTWAGSPAVSKMIEGSNSLNNEQDVQGYAMHRVGEYVTKHGARPCAWEEAALGKNGGISKNALLFSWTGQGAGLDAARRGYQVVMCPGQNAYLDMAHTDDKDNWGATWAAIISLKDTVNWDPVPENEPGLSKQIIGVQSTFWGEFTTTDSEIEPMLAPRILGAAPVAWSPRGRVNENNIVDLANWYSRLFESIGWTHNQDAIRPN